jgi:hypothetical protein
MWTDPIVAEVRRWRAEYSAQFNDDLDAICRDLRRLQESSGREVIMQRNSGSVRKDEQDDQQVA